VSTVFFDIDTQIDFLYPAGALYVPGAERIVENIATLNRFAAQRGIPVISTMDAHSEDDPEFRDWPPHCVVGTAGQAKPACTLLDKRVTVPNKPGLPALEGVQQILLEKQALDCFTNVNLNELLKQLSREAWRAGFSPLPQRDSTKRCVVYGVVTEICVARAAIGLLKTGRSVELVEDAVCSLNDAERDKFLAEFTAAGGATLAARQLLDAL
jgi:nicotinamidase/pyrazinamidase